MRRLALLLLCLPLLVLAAAPVSAGSVDEVVAGLARDGVHVDPESDLDVDETALRSAVLGASVPFYVAVLPAAAGSGAALSSLVVEIGTALGDTTAVVLVATDAGELRADNGEVAGDRGVRAGDALEAALDDVDGDLTADSLTALVRDVVRRVDAQAGGGSGGTGTTSGSGLLVPLLVVGALAVGVWAVSSVRRRRASGQQLEDLRADVESLYGRLGSDVSLLSPGDDAVARQALADAAERYGATGALMATADSPGEWAAARRTAIEGITAARVVRQRLGLDPGPDVPPLPSGQVPPLAEPATVQVGEETYAGSPAYEPGRPHYFEGGVHSGGVIPGGWYATPFWQSLVLGGLLGGLGQGSGRGYRRSGGGLSGGGLGGIGGSRRTWSGGGRSGRSGGFGGFGGGGGWSGRSRGKRGGSW